MNKKYKKVLRTRGGFVQYIPTPWRTKAVGLLKQGATAAAPFVYDWAAKKIYNKTGIRVSTPPRVGKPPARREINYHEATTANLSQSYSIIGRPARKKTKLYSSLTPQFRYTCSQQAHLTGGVVDQQTVVGFDMFSGSDWSNALVQGRTDIQYAVAAGIDSNLAGKVRLEYGTAKLYMQSASNVGQIVDIYECFPRRDYPIDAYSAFVNGMSYESPTGSGKLLASDLNSTPFMSSPFTDAYYVRRVKTINMPAGSAHVHNVTRHINKMISNYRLQASGVSTHMAGISMHLICIARGSVIHDSVDKTQVGISGTAVDFKLEMVLKYELPAVMGTFNNKGDTSPQSIATAQQTTLNTVVDTNVVEN